MRDFLQSSLFCYYMMLFSGGFGLGAFLRMFRDNDAWGWFFVSLISLVGCVMWYNNYKRAIEREW